MDDSEELRFCFAAYPAASSKRWRDPDNKCRTITPFIRNLDYGWTFNRRDVKSSQLKRGMCILDSNPSRRCALSWDNNDKSNSRASRGATSIIRPRPE